MGNPNGLSISILFTIAVFIGINHLRLLPVRISNGKLSNSIGSSLPQLSDLNR